MKGPIEFSRRRFLSVLAGLGVIGLFNRLPWAQDSNQLPERLAQVYRHPQSAAVVGRAYLKSAPHEADAQTLTTLISVELGPDRQRLLTLDTNRLRSTLHNQVHEDFKNRRTVMVDGWILAQTEARLCALTAVLA